MKTRTRPAARRGFSLIELLVVISIIGILSGLLLAGVGRVRVAAQRAQASADIAQLGTAVAAFKAKFNVDYLPSGFSLESNYTDSGSNAADGAYLKQLFPQIDLANTGLPNESLNQNRSLVFFLSGGTVTNYTGFSINRAAPFGTGGTSRIGPFYEFSAAKLNASGEFVDPWKTPYGYFASVNGIYSGTIGTMSPFTEGGRSVQQRGFQIISAGPNGQFGLGGDYRGTNVGSYSGTSAGADDMANFAQAGNLKQD